MPGWLEGGNVRPLTNPQAFFLCVCSVVLVVILWFGGGEVNKRLNEEEQKETAHPHAIKRVSRFGRQANG